MTRGETDPLKIVGDIYLIVPKTNGSSCFVSPQEIIAG